MLQLKSTPIPGVFEAQTTPYCDDRGQLARLFCLDELRTAHADRPIVQINHSLTHQLGALRGLHFQYPPHAEAKWVRCLHGRVFDVVIDLRHGSPTLLRWYGCELDSQRQNAIFIPEGCAHGFQTLEPDCELLYLHTAAYEPRAEGGVRYDDPRIGVHWPLAVTDLSPRDRQYEPLKESFQGLVL
jgi:dTDP-4-dehydrorhamnose 3,5-epimerase